MTANLRGWFIFGTGLALTVGFLTVGSDSPAQDKGMVDAVGKVADALDKKDAAGAKKMAVDTAKKIEIEDLMHLYALRTKKGFGVGDKPGAIAPDGIEKKLMKLAETELTAKEIADDFAALTQMGNRMASIAEITHAKPPEKDEGKKKRKDWVAWSIEQRDASLEFAAAAKAKNTKDLFKAAVKTDKACGKCHDVFRFD